MKNFARYMSGTVDLALFDCVSFALEDHVVSRLVYQLALDLGIGATGELVPSSNEPKELHGFLALP